MSNPTWMRPPTASRTRHSRAAAIGRRGVAPACLAHAPGGKGAHWLQAAAALLLSAALLAPAAADEDAWSLLDHNGHAVTRERLREGFALVYFGYTYCPDICPLGLFTASTALKEVGEPAAQVTPWFVTVDPDRDTVERLAPYVAAFHPRMVGVTGQAPEIRKMARDYDARFTVAVLGDDYFVDHSAYLYLQGPDGRVLERFGHDIGAREIAAAIERYLRP